MSKTNWAEILNWGKEQVQDLRCTGFRYIVEGKYEIARLYFEALVILEPENIYDARTLGAVYLELDHPQRAIYYLGLSLKKDPHHLPTILNRAKALFALGKKEKGKRLAEYLSKAKKREIAEQAEALIMAYC